MWWLSDFFDLLEAALWPLVLLFIFLCLKKDIGCFIRNIRKLKHGDTTVEIGETLDRLNTEVSFGKDKNISLSTEQVQEIKALAHENIKKIKFLYEDPRIIIIEAWASFENILREMEGGKVKATSLAEALGGFPIFKIIRKLAAEGKISDVDEKVLKEIKNIRNDIMHNFQINVSLQDAKDYAEILETIILKIQNPIKN
jgi:hypothetical protein